MTLASVFISKSKLHFPLGLIPLAVLVLCPVLAQAGPSPQAQAKQPLGSLSAVGQVYVDRRGRFPRGVIIFLM